MRLAAIALAAALAWGLVLYNRLVRLRNGADGAWSDVDVQLARRHDLVGNLVETVAGYALHERTTLERITHARSRAERARRDAGPDATGRAEIDLSTQIRQLFAVSEAYPDLLASGRFRDLQRALVTLEDDIQNARRYYNAIVRDFNTRVQSIPDLIVARSLGFREREFFQLDDPGEAQAPQLTLDGQRE